VKATRTLIPILALFYLCGGLARAQSVDAYVGLGTAMDSSNQQATNTFGDGTIYYPPRMGGLFMIYGGDFMFTPHFGVGAESSFRTSQGSYAGLTYRPTFYDFNGIWHPLSATRRIVPEFQGGLGAANLKFYLAQQNCDSFAGCSSSNSYLESSNHFQAHFSTGVRFYVKDNVFIRPQVDVHWVKNLFQFGSNWVPEYGAAIGYSFGRK
jgi:hypothetical protein